MATSCTVGRGKEFSGDTDENFRSRCAPPPQANRTLVHRALAHIGVPFLNSLEPDPRYAILTEAGFELPGSRTLTDVSNACT